MSLEILTYGWTSVFDVDKRQFEQISDASI